MTFIQSFYMTVYLIMPVICLAALGRDISVAARIWFIAGTAQASAVVAFNLFATGAQAPAALGSVIAGTDFVSIFCAALHLSALWLDLELKPRFRRVFAQSALLAATAFGLWLIGGSWHSLFMLLINAAFGLYISHWLMRLVAREGGRWGIYVRGFQALTVVRLGMMLLVVYVPAMNSMTGDFAQGATFFIGLASAAESFCANVAYLGVNIDSLRRKIVEIGRESAKKDERERLKDAMALMDRQRTAGIMSAAISHELKQPLTWALTNTQLAMRLLVNGQPGPVQQLVKIEDALRRAGRIIDGLQSFMRPDAAAPRLLDIRLAVESAVQLLAPKLKKDKVQLVVELGSHPLLAVADDIQLCQVFVNVLRNAIQACQDQPIRKVSVTAEEVGGKLRVRIQDTGVGFPEQVITAIGLPFSTQNAEGLGLGLAVCQNIMASFGGSLLLHNASAGGAVVEIELLT